MNMEELLVPKRIYGGERPALHECLQGSHLTLRMTGGPAFDLSCADGLTTLSTARICIRHAHHRQQLQTAISLSTENTFKHKNAIRMLLRLDSMEEMQKYGTFNSI